jgi:flagellar biosynthetic protein FliP
MKKISYIFIFCIISFPILAQEFPIPRINIGIDRATKPEDVALTLQVIFLLTILSLAPAIVMMVTSFVKIVVVLSFVKRALATQELPPTQVIMALAFFLTLFVMMPTIQRVYNDAIKPFLNHKITTGEEFYNKAIKPIREFMFRQIEKGKREKDIDLFMYLAGKKRPKNRDDVPTYVLIPAFMISELTKAFWIGVILFIPFIIIDMVVSSTLMSMGMIMVPPAMISLPFKIILFVLVDGWHLLAYELVRSYVR